MILLTERQKQVVSGVAASMTRKEIGKALCLSVKAVEFHLTKAARAIGLDRNNEALFTRYAIENRLIKIDPLGNVDAAYIWGDLLFDCQCSECTSGDVAKTRVHLGQSRPAVFQPPIRFGLQHQRRGARVKLADPAPHQRGCHRRGRSSGLNKRFSPEP